MQIKKFFSSKSAQLNKLEKITNEKDERKITPLYVGNRILISHINNDMTLFNSFPNHNLLSH